MSEAPPIAPAAATIGPPPGVTNLMIVNVSTTVGADEFNRAVAAIGAQVNGAFKAAWGVGANLAPSRLNLGGRKVNVDGVTHAIIYLGESISDPTAGASGVFGYHNRTRGGLPYAFVYLDICALRGEPWTCALSHEVMELLADRDTTSTAPGPAPEGSDLDGPVPYGLEVCDPTQSDHYEVDGVLVANFVTRAYFGEGPAGAPTNHLELDLAPFGVRPGGYVMYDDGATMQRISGSAVDPDRRRAEALMAEHRRNARREAMLRPPEA